MAVSIGLKTSTHVFICSEMALSSSIIKIKETEDSTTLLSNTLLNITGSQADTLSLKSYAVECSKLLSYENRIPVTPSLVTKVCVNKIYSALRKDPLECQVLVGGLNDSNSLELYSIDRYGACNQDNFVVTGYGLYFLFGVYDMSYRKDMAEDEAIGLIMKCLKVLKEKIILETDKWKLDIIGLNGVKTSMIDLNSNIE